MGMELRQTPAIKTTAKHKQNHEQIESSVKPGSNHSNKLNSL